MSLPPTIPRALDLAAERFADREALVDHSGPSEVRLTFAQLRHEARRLARALLARGLGAGDRVAVNAPNSHHWVLAALGILYAGATLVPVNTRYTGFETADVLRRSGARALVVAGPFLGVDRLAALREALSDGTLPPEIHTVVQIPAGTDSVVPDSAALQWHELDGAGASVGWDAVDAAAGSVHADDTSDILYTSGTTGLSKGAVSTHASALGVADAWAACGEVSERDRYLVVNPFFHSFGYKAGILVCLLRGATIVPMPVFDVANALDLVQRERITVLPGAPTLYQSILDAPDRRAHDLTSLRLAVTGAATVPVVLVERMQQELNFSTVLTAYGLTEAVVATMCRPGDDPATVATTCGRAAAGFDLRIVDRDGTSLRAGEVGEIQLRGPHSMRGYLDDAEATAEAFGQDGWLRTGDLGSVDDRGYLTITDRLKDMYICGGFNVYPAEVEQTLARLDGVADSAVVGVPDDRLGEVGKAYVVADAAHAVSAEDVVVYCKQRLANYKVPRSVEFRDTLPRNPSGKVLKRDLR
ncbi:AMP-binding protein [Allosaccharopolyspora coralli]|uniref:AMP-binding protein n=1 Tax=Allosaccharopolyspora coralli TaxID=2665642 RepID=A0A5Q3Q7C1_9PSEU|nr:FadD3 family acyl-CoA ligase [Allosaccharopolyspora coralli]QGK70372.1 AMP-binding protein [Allosaccharopolyspora coralli]